MWSRAVSKRTKALQVIVAVCALIPLMLTWEIRFNDSWLGFRDHYITAYDHAMRLPHQLFCAFSVAVTIAIIYCAWRRHWQAAVLAVGLYAFAAYVTFDVLDGYYYNDLDHGQGG